MTTQTHNEKSIRRTQSTTTSTATTVRPNEPLQEKSGQAQNDQAPQLNFKPHHETSSALLEALNTNVNFGLSEEEVEKRRQVYGENRLKEVKGVSGFKIILRQVGNAMTLILSEFWL